MVPSMVDRLWRAVSLGFQVASIFHSTMLARSRVPCFIVFRSSLGHLSGPRALPSFRQYSVQCTFAIS